MAAVIKTFYYYAGAYTLINSSRDDSYEPLGVVTVFGCYDSPLLSVAAKIACALATGNTCLCMPSSQTPLSAFLLAEICVQSGVPAGVLNVLVNDSAIAKRQIVRNPFVACVTFDGTTQTAQDLIKSSAVDVNKKLILSTSGKSTLIVYENADNDSAIESIVDGCLYANGQHRYSLNKVLIQESIFDEVVERLQMRFRKLRVGSNLDKCNDYGPFICESESKVFIDNLVKFQSCGADLVYFNECAVQGGISSAQPPVLILNLETNTEFYQSDVNGPYIMLIPFRTVKESIELVNQQRAGSAVSLWSQNISLVLEVAYALQCGTVWINSFGVEKGVQVRKMSGNYTPTGEENILTFTRPSWSTPFSVGNEQVDMEKLIKGFGGAEATAVLPKADPLVNVKTYKLYIGGKQTRPDSQSSRNYFGQNGSLQCLLPDAGRKDVRNAVEAAYSAFNE